MLNLIGEGLAKGTKKALQETAEEVGEKAAAKVAKKGAKETGESALSKIVSKTPVAASDIADGKLSKLIEKAKNYKTPERFYKMNNPIKGSEIWGDKPASIFQRDNRAVRVNMFPNDAVKGTGMTKQYLLNMLKDAYDQGITSIVPSYGIYTKEGASFMDHLAEQGWLDAATSGSGYKSYSIAPKIQEWEKTTPLEDIFQQAHTLKSKGPSLVDMARNIKAMRASRNMAEDGIRRIGSSAVAKVDPSTLPAGYGKLVNYLNGDQTAMLEKTIGKELDDTAAPEAVKQYLKEVGYDIKPNYIDNVNTARQVLFDELLDDMNMSGSPYTRFLETRNKLEKDNFGKGVGPRSFTISADDDMLYQTAAAKLDREYSDRLGIGRSHTPMNDNALGPDTRGVYMAGGIGIDPYYATGETGVSTAAHERMHAWQDANSGWDSRVTDAIGELRDELKNFYHDKPTIKKYRGNNYDIDYYLDPKEQEARMLQSYLDNEGFTDTHHKHDARGVEWGNEIKPAFDKFYDKLRTLSKAGVALPAVGLALLLGENYNNKKKEG